MTLDTISSDDPANPPHRPAAPRGTALGGGARATALTTAVALVLAGGVATAAYRSATTGTAPAALVPASAFAFAQVDLDLPSGQDQALSAFLGHFPDAPTRIGHGSVRDKVLTAIFRDSSDPHVDYVRDVRPWLGDRAAVAGWIDGHGKAQAEFLLRSTDDAKARRSLHRLAPSAGVTFRSGYAVISSSPALAEQSATEAHRASLADSPGYRHDVGTLSGPQVALAWADYRGLARAIDTASGLAQLRLLPGGAAMTSRLGTLKGREVAGVHVTRTYAELDVRTIGTARTTAASPSTLLRQLPDGTIAAAEISQPGIIVTAVTSGLSAFLGMATAGAAGVAGEAVPATPGFAPYVPTSPGQPAQQAPTEAPPVMRTLDPLARIQQATGLSLPGEAGTLLGSEAVISYGGLHPGALPDVALRSHPRDLAQAQTLAGHSRDVIARRTGVRVTVAATGGDLVVATTPAYAAAVAATGHLAAQPMFATALGGLPAQVTFAAYVNLADILPLLPHAANHDVDHLKAFGMWSGVDTAQARLVVG